MSTPRLTPTVRAFAAMPNGVHAISREKAVELVRASRADVADESVPLVWVDIVNPGEDEATFMRDELGFHPLAVEDCVRGRQRPKLDRYTDYLFLVIYAAAINPDRDRMALNELHLFLGRRFIATVHDYKVEEIGEIVARWRASWKQGSEVGDLAYLLLDAVVDDYFPVLEHFASRADAIESETFQRTTAVGMQQILLLRHELVIFRRIVAPQRDVVTTLLRRDVPFLRPELLPYFQDVHDHTMRVTEEIDALRELLSALLDAQFSLSANQLNHTMRTMTAWSIILMSMGLVGGIYGMNFAFMPELNWRWGYFAALALMGGIGIGLVSFFRHRRWL